MSQQRGGAAIPYYTPQKKQALSSTPAVPPTQPPIPSKQPGTPTKVQQPSLKPLERLWRETRKTLKGQFSVMAIVTVLLALVLAWFVSQSFNRASNDLNTIANGSVPSVDAAQALAQYIDDIDAKAADFLGTADLKDASSPCNVPSVGQPIKAENQQVYQCDKLSINAEFLLANQQLFTAAHNVTYPGERTAIERITEGLQEYNGHLTVMMYEFEQVANKGNANDPHLKAAYQAYLEAGKVLHTQIERQPKTASGTFAYSEPANTVPTCQPKYPNGPTLRPDQWASGSLETNLDCLSAINHFHLDAAYADTMSFVGVTLIGTIILCIIFCLVLLFATVRMIITTHRVINPGLLLALIASIVLSMASVSVFASLRGNHGAYGQIVKDDYQSVYAANLLKRVGTNTNADESRWLIALQFNNADEVKRWADDWQSKTDEVNSLRKQARANQIWPEEIQPLADIDTNWQTYYDIDTQIRSAANNSNDPQHLHTAEKLSTGDSNKAFGNFTDAVDQLKKVNYDHYYATLNTTQNILNLYIRLSAIVFPLIGLAAVWGISQRFKDL